MGEQDGWVKYQKLILSELKRLSDEQKTMNRSLIALRLDVAALKAKAATWGAAAGFVVSSAVQFLIGKMH